MRVLRIFYILALVICFVMIILEGLMFCKVYSDIETQSKQQFQLRII